MPFNATAGGMMTDNWHSKTTKAHLEHVTFMYVIENEIISDYRMYRQANVITKFIPKILRCSHSFSMHVQLLTLLNQEIRKHCRSG